jgi:hypothetical protein
MRKRIPLFAAFVAVAGLAAALLPPARAAGAPEVSVTVDPRVELLSIIFRLAGNPEYRQGRVQAYNEDIDRQFAPFQDDPVVKLAAKLRETRDVSFDAVMGLAVHVADAFDLKEAVPFDPLPASLDSRWTPASAREFLALARGFVAASDFKGFIERHQPLYRRSVERFTGILRAEGHLEWYDAFFGDNKGFDFRVVLGMSNGGACYGVHHDRADGRSDIYSILGVWRVDGQGDPVFESDMLSTIVHEFNHSYTNSLVDRFAEEMRPAAEKIFGVVEDDMSRQAYGTWKTMLYESLNRACTLRYALAYKGRAAMARAAEAERGRGFYWVGDLAELLGEYDRQPRAYPDLAAFFPRIVAFFNAYAEGVDALAVEIKDRKVKRLQEWREKGPKIVSMTPADGATDVDPGLKAIVVTFDRPMRAGTYAVMLLGDMDHFPGSGKGAGFDLNRRVFTIPTKPLKPDWEYTFGLNDENTPAFAAWDGVPLYPVVVKFKTRK